MRIHVGHERRFSQTRTPLELLLPPDRLIHRVVNFVVNKLIDLVGGRELSPLSILVLPDTSLESRGHSRIQDRSSGIGENVDIPRFHNTFSREIASFRDYYSRLGARSSQ